MDTREQARVLVRRLVALGVGGPHVVRKAAARALARCHPLDATALLHAVQALARAGDVEAASVLPAVLAALQREADRLPSPEALARVARLQTLEDVAALFVEEAPARTLDPRAAARADARAFSQPLGYLKQQARLTRDPDELTRLAMASNPMVTRNILLNPRLTEALVVRMAARRPVRPEPLVEIWRSARWASRTAVRRALVFNPYLPPEVGAKLVPLLAVADLEELARDGAVHPALRQQASVLLGRIAAGEPRPGPGRQAPWRRGVQERGV